MTISSSLFTLLVLSSFFGCEGEPGEEPPTTDLSYHQDIAPLLSRSCVGCHDSASTLGAMDLSSYAQTQLWGPVIATEVDAGTMPPWRASTDCNSYQDTLALSEDEKADIVDWIAGGMPAGDPDVAAELPEPRRPATLDRVDLKLTMPVAFTPSESPDDYRCFLMEWPSEEDVWVTGFEITPGNLETVHHVIPYLINPDDADDYRAMDEADEGEGYRCYGGPGGDVTTLINTRWLGSWAPGGGASTFPEGTGLRVEPGSLVAFQVHYYVEAGTVPGSDQSSIQLKIEEQAQGWGDVQPWTDVNWVLGTGMEVPPKTNGTTHTFSYELGESDRFAMHSLALHMHTLGRSGRMVIKHSDGSETCLIDVPAYDFNWQRSYILEEPYVAEP
ncbi:MAG: hypothetical protein ACI9VR_004233, partial [Cognaticolwellia sp.]